MRVLIICILLTQVFSVPGDTITDQKEVIESEKDSVELEDEYIAIANSAEVRAKSQELLKKISDPKDSALQRQIKEFMAEYLVVTAITDDEKESELALENSIGGKSFGRDKHRPHHNLNLNHHNRDRDRNRNRDRDNIYNSPNPTNSPIIVQVQNYLPAPAQPVAAAPAPVYPAYPAAAPVYPAPAPAYPAAAPVYPAPAPVYPAPAPAYPAAAPAPSYPIAPAVATVPLQNNEPRQEVTTAAPQPPPVPVITGAPAAPAPAPIAQAPAPVATQAPVIVQAPVTQAPVVVTQAPVTRRPTVDPIHHLNQVNKILGNVATGNIVGIVDESLAIRTPQPVRTLVTNILKVVFCNPIDRLFNRCAPNQIAAANTRQ